MKARIPIELAPATPNGITPLISAHELSTILGISKRTVWRLLSGKQLPAPVRIGGSVRWRRDQICNWINEGCPAI